MWLLPFLVHLTDAGWAPAEHGAEKDQPGAALTGLAPFYFDDDAGGGDDDDDDLARFSPSRGPLPPSLHLPALWWAEDRGPQRGMEGLTAQSLSGLKFEGGQRTFPPTGLFWQELLLGLVPVCVVLAYFLQKTLFRSPSVYFSIFSP